MSFSCFTVLCYVFVVFAQTSQSVCGNFRGAIFSKSDFIAPNHGRIARKTSGNLGYGYGRSTSFHRLQLVSIMFSLVVYVSVREMVHLCALSPCNCLIGLGMLRTAGSS